MLTGKLIPDIRLFVCLETCLPRRGTNSGAHRSSKAEGQWFEELYGLLGYNSASLHGNTHIFSRLRRNLGSWFSLLKFEVHVLFSFLLPIDFFPLIFERAKNGALHRPCPTGDCWMIS